MGEQVCLHEKVAVQAYRDELRSAWDSYVDNHPSGSPFHLIGWKRAIERTYGFDSRYLLVEERGEVSGILPLFLVSNPILGRALISTPFAVYGGICASNREAWRALREAACRMAQEERVQYLELRERQAFSDPEFHTKRLYVTFGQKLPRTVDALLRGFPRDTRYMIRKGQKNGLSTVVDNAQLDIFYEIYAHSVHALGTPVFAKKFLKSVVDEFTEHCEIAVIWHKRKAIAGVLSLRFRDYILPYYGGSLKEGRGLAANNFMYWEIMKRAIELGLRYFDFGRSKLGSGSHAFKAQWNMQEVPLPYQVHLVRQKVMPNYSPANPRFKPVIEIWKHMPFSLTKVIGPTLARLFP